MNHRGGLISMFPMRGTISGAPGRCRNSTTYIHVPHAGNNLNAWRRFLFVGLISMFPMRGTILNNWRSCHDRYLYPCSPCGEQSVGSTVGSAVGLISMFPMRGTIFKAYNLRDVEVTYIHVPHAGNNMTDDTQRG